MRALITGGAGFIGSHLAEALVEHGLRVRIFDDFSTGSGINLNTLLKRGDQTNVEVMKGNCTDSADCRRALSEADVVFHLAACSEVRPKSSNQEACFRNNTLATRVLLSEMRRSKANTIVFASSSTVYGDAKTIPTPEDYSPLNPISFYGTSKLTAEGLISSYCHTYGLRAVLLRLANVVGPRCRHGVVHDFVRRLTNDSKELKVLGDGLQSKSYVWIRDCVSGVLKAWESRDLEVEAFNIGSEDRVTVTRIARIAIKEMKLSNVRIKCTGGIDGGRGWRGDVKIMQLDVGKLKARGWRPEFRSEEAVRLAIRSLVSERRPSV
jgi:UDP-glucose 4-epimerase